MRTANVFEHVQSLIPIGRLTYWFFGHGYVLVCLAYLSCLPLIDWVVKWFGGKPWSGAAFYPLIVSIFVYVIDLCFAITARCLEGEGRSGVHAPITIVGPPIAVKKAMQGVIRHLQRHPSRCRSIVSPPIAFLCMPLILLQGIAASRSQTAYLTLACVGLIASVVIACYALYNHKIVAAARDGSIVLAARKWGKITILSTIGSDSDTTIGLDLLNFTLCIMQNNRQVICISLYRLVSPQKLMQVVHAAL